MPPAICKLKCCFIYSSHGESKGKGMALLPLEKASWWSKWFLVPSTSYGTVARMLEEISCQTLNSMGVIRTPVLVLIELKCLTRCSGLSHNRATCSQPWFVRSRFVPYSYLVIEVPSLLLVDASDGLRQPHISWGLVDFQTPNQKTHFEDIGFRFPEVVHGNSTHWEGKV